MALTTASSSTGRRNRVRVSVVEASSGAIGISSRQMAKPCATAGLGHDRRRVAVERPVHRPDVDGGLLREHAARPSQTICTISSAAMVGVIISASAERLTRAQWAVEVGRQPVRRSARRRRRSSRARRRDRRRAHHRNVAIVPLAFEIGADLGAGRHGSLLVSVGAQTSARGAGEVQRVFGRFGQKRVEIQGCVGHLDRTRRRRAASPPAGGRGRSRCRCRRDR